MPSGASNWAARRERSRDDPSVFQSASASASALPQDAPSGSRHLLLSSSGGQRRPSSPSGGFAALMSRLWGSVAASITRADGDSPGAKGSADSEDSTVDSEPAVSSEEGASGAVGYYSPSDNPPFWYSFDYGIVHFTVVSTEHDLTPGSLQYEWLQVLRVWTPGV